LGTDKEMELSFVELRTLMVATDWEDLKAMENLAIAGNVSSYLANMINPTLK